MGKRVEMTGKRKKKGRPSLLELQKRQLKLQQEQREEELKKKHQLEQIQQQQQLKRTHNQSQNPNPVRRSSRRNPNPDPDSPGTDDNEESAVPSNSASNPNDEDGHSSKRRKVETIGGRSEQKGEPDASTNKAYNHQEAEVEDGPSTPLPDKTLLVFILDRLQKKDTYGVFAEPVDPEELPDYHEVIEHPMDFSTIRNNLENGVYKNLEQLERDVLLLCSNAMQYNAPGTVYFRQARAIQELANKNFEDLRQDSDGHEQQPQPKVARRGRPPTKHLKKPVENRLQHTNASYHLSETSNTLATPGANASSSSELRKATLKPEKYGSAVPSSMGHVSYNNDVYIGWSGDKYDDRIINGNSAVSTPPKYIVVKNGKEQIILDENRRNTYKVVSGPVLPGTSSSRQDRSVLLTFCGVRKQLVPVGIDAKYGYARSLARFAAKLGPTAWKIASKKIEGCLPSSVKFGPGWVGEDEAPSGLVGPENQPSSSTEMPNLETSNNRKSQNSRASESGSGSRVGSEEKKDEVRHDLNVGCESPG